MLPILVSADQISHWLAQFLWPFFRVAALFSILPILGGGEVPVRVRVAFAAAFTFLIMPLIPEPPLIDPLSLNAVIVIAQQIIIGIAMGLIVLLVFNAVTLAGESIAITMGLGFALMNDPQNGIQVPTVSQFYLILATLLFISFNGHHAILILLESSFTGVPVGQSLQQHSIWEFLSWTKLVFAGALSIALPALAAMLSVNIVMGVVTRAAPQLNLFSVGFPITMTVGFLAILLTLPLFRKSLESYFLEGQSAIVQLLGG